MADGVTLETGDMTIESGDVRIWPLARGKVKITFLTPERPEIEFSAKKPEIIFS